MLFGFEVRTSCLSIRIW